MTTSDTLVAVERARILVVDDQEMNVGLLKASLRSAGLDGVRGVTDAREVLEVFITYRPDIVLLDLHMPHLDGFAVMAQLSAHIPEGEYLPIVVLTADITRESKIRALSLGAKDFLHKPFDPTEVGLRVRNLLETRLLSQHLRGENDRLEKRVRERTAELESAYAESLDQLARAVEYRDDNTGQHTIRVGRTAGLIAAELGLPAPLVDLIRRAAPLHDVGKIGVPDDILCKPGRLTPEEFETIKAHTSTGAKILVGSHSPLLQLAEEIALTHHEKWDGTGYGGLAGEAIPLAGRIVAVADVFDALTHARPYKPAWPADEALAEVARQTGLHFDPRVVKAFMVVCEAQGWSERATSPARDQGATSLQPEHETRGVV